MTIEYDREKAKENFDKNYQSFTDVWAEDPRVAVMNRETHLGFLGDNSFEIDFELVVKEDPRYPNNLITFEA